MAHIKFRQVSIANFGPFAGEQTLALDGIPGLIFVSGRNEVKPELVANGIGKSHLFDAITFGSYGRTADGTRGPDLINWHTGETAVVALQLQRDGIAHTIRRTIRPNSLTLQRRGEEAHPVEQHVIDDLLGCRLEAFLACVHHGQGLESFLDMGPTAQLDLLSELLDLEIYARASDIAKQSADAAMAKINECNVSLAAARGKLIELDRQVDELDTKESKYLRQRYQFLRDVDREKTGWQRQLVVEQRKCADFRRQLAEIDDTELRALKVTADKASHDLARQSAESHMLRTRRAQLYRALKETLTCPTCNRPFADAAKAENHAKEELKKIDAELAGFDTAIKELRTKENSSTTRLLSMSKQHSDLSNDINAKLREQDGVVGRLEGTIAQLESRKKELSVEPNPYTVEIEDLNQRMADARGHVGRLNFKLLAAMRREASFSYWTKGFKDLRLSVVEAALMQLTLQVNNVLGRLGLDDWRLVVEAEGITKAGTVKRGMRIAVMMGNQERPVSRVSFGERQRLRLAIALGVADMIQSITGSSFNLEMFDEPTSWLTQPGVESLLSVLTDRAVVNSRRILIADHRSHSWPFQSTVTIVKDQQGARFDG